MRSAHSVWSGSRVWRKMCVGEYWGRRRGVTGVFEDDKSAGEVFVKF